MLPAALRIRSAIAQVAKYFETGFLLFIIVSYKSPEGPELVRIN